MFTILSAQVDTDNPFLIFCFSIGFVGILATVLIFENRVAKLKHELNAAKKKLQEQEAQPQPTDNTKLLNKAQEVLLQHTINRARIVCREAKQNGEECVKALIASTDVEACKANGIGSELYNTAIWLRDKYLCCNLDSGKPYFFFDHFDAENIDMTFDAYLNPANRDQLDAMFKEVYDSFNTIG